MNYIEEEARRNWEQMRRNAQRSLAFEARQMSNRQIVKYLNQGGLDYDLSFVRKHRDVCEDMVIEDILNKMFPET